VFPGSADQFDTTQAEVAKNLRQVLLTIDPSVASPSVASPSVASTASSCTPGRAEGAYLHVYGDAVAIAGGADRALHEIVAEHGYPAPDEVAAYVDGLRRGHRYLRDVH